MTSSTPRPAVVVLRRPVRQTTLALLPLLVSLWLIAFRQLIVNILGLDRRAITSGALLLAASTLAWYGGRALLQRNITRSSLVATALWLIQFVAWVALAAATQGLDAQQLALGLVYDSGLSAFALLPLLARFDLRSLRFTALHLLLICSTAAVAGLLQFALRDDAPQFLAGDSTYFIAPSVLGVRPSGLVGNSIVYGFAAAVSSVAWFRLATRTRFRLGTWLATLISFYAVIISQSRIYIVLTVLLVAFYFLRTKQIALHKSFAVIILLALVLLFYVPEGYYATLTSTEFNPALALSNRDHVGQLRSGYQVFKENLWTGLGVGKETSFTYESERRIVTDGFWLTLLLDGGLSGVLPLFLFLMFCYFLARKGVKRLRTAQQHLTADVCTVPLVLAVASNLVNSSLNNVGIMIMFYLSLGLLLRAGDIKARVIAPSVSDRSRKAA